MKPLPIAERSIMAQTLRALEMILAVFLSKIFPFLKTEINFPLSSYGHWMLYKTHEPELPIIVWI